MSGTERGETTPKDVAARWMRAKGIARPESGQQIFTGDPKALIEQAYDLFVEREDLRSEIVRRQRSLMEPLEVETPPNERWSRYNQAYEKAGEQLEEVNETGFSLEQKRQLILEGRVSDIIPSQNIEGTPVEVVKRSQARVQEIDHALDQVFSTPSIHEHFLQDLSRQVRIRQYANEVQALQKFPDQVDILTTKIAREANVQKRSLTTVERNFIDENNTLKEAAAERQKELLQDPDVSDKARLLVLREYQRVLRSPGRFAETSSRRAYLKRIENAWAEGKKVLLTGETGTGKTEMVKHASRKLFGVDPESVTGHQDMSIYELLGKTGFRVQEGDVFRPAPLIRAMVGQEGKGQPFLLDEIDRTPNQALMGIKTIMNARPGDKGIRVQTDTAGSFDIGPDYAFAATANIKSERYATATELDPAIVRVFDAPMDVDFMPSWEVYDLALASLIDRRGGIPLTRENAEMLLKNLCDAASWTQDAFQGRKVITNSETDEFLEARGQATTGRSATLAKAVLDPGKTIEMLQGWMAAEAKGLAFEDYLNDKIVDFINNRAYPEEDRYYLIEIFALKGFLRGKGVSELRVSGLTQETLNRWIGTAEKPARIVERAYLPPLQVAKLDPYQRFETSISAEAKELLSEDIIAEKEPQISKWVPIKEMVSDGTIGSTLIAKIDDLAERLRPETTFNQPLTSLWTTSKNPVSRELQIAGMKTVDDVLRLPEGQLSTFTEGVKIQDRLEEYLRELMITPHAKIIGLAYGGQQVPIPKNSESDLIEAVNDAIENLSINPIYSKKGNRRGAVLRYRFGLDDGITRTLEQVGKIFGVSGTSMRSDEHKALRLMRTPSISKNLARFFSLPEDSFKRKLGYVFEAQIPRYIDPLFQDPMGWDNTFSSSTQTELEEFLEKTGEVFSLDLDITILSKDAQDEIIQKVKEGIMRIEAERSATVRNP